MHLGAGNNKHLLKYAVGFSWRCLRTRHTATALAIAAAVVTAASCGAPPTEVPAGYGIQAGFDLPAQALDLTNWKITLPYAAADQDRPVEIEQPELQRFEDEYFEVANNPASVIFRANVGGVPQPGSEFARTELREMTDRGLEEAAWSSKSGYHTMSIVEAVTHLPTGRPSLVAGQIHDEDEYIALIRLDGNKLYVKADDRNIGDLDANYQLGTVFTVRMEAADGNIKVFYNGEKKVDYERTCDTCYFKAGAYLQTNVDRGDSDNDYGEVRIYDLTVGHTPTL